MNRGMMDRWRDEEVDIQMQGWVMDRSMDLYIDDGWRDGWRKAWVDERMEYNG